MSVYCTPMYLTNLCCASNVQNIADQSMMKIVSIERWYFGELVHPSNKKVQCNIKSIKNVIIGSTGCSLFLLHVDMNVFFATKDFIRIDESTNEPK